MIEDSEDYNPKVQYLSTSRDVNSSYGILEYPSVWSLCV